MKESSSDDDEGGEGGDDDVDLLLLFVLSFLLDFSRLWGGSMVGKKETRGC